jgi:replicative DNA helicase
MSFSFFETLEGGFQRSKITREENKKFILSFGVPYLDHALGGILKTDVVLLAGKSGQGKSEMAVQISLANAMAGKTVYHFALEAEKDEIANRVGYKALVRRLYQSKFYSSEKPNFLEWILGRQDHLVGKFENEVAEELRALSNFRVVYRNEQFTIEDFEKCLMAAKHDADLIVLDHLHYLDFDDENENQAYKRIVKKIRTLALEYSKPIVLVAHVRKGDRRAKELVPGVEDIHGSSDIFKIATKAITIAPAFDYQISEGKSFRLPTYIRIGKSRHDGSRARYTGLVVFNAKDNAYESKYKIGQLSPGGDEWTETLEIDRPFWFKGDTK